MNQKQLDIATFPDLRNFFYCIITADSNTHTHANTVVCGYGLSTGPTEGLILWLSRNRSPLDSKQHKSNTLHDIGKHHVFKKQNPLHLFLQNKPAGAN